MGVRVGVAMVVEVAMEDSEEETVEDFGIAVEVDEDLIDEDVEDALVLVDVAGLHDVVDFDVAGTLKHRTPNG